MMHYAQVPDSFLRRKVAYSANDAFEKKEKAKKRKEKEMLI